MLRGRPSSTASPGPPVLSVPTKSRGLLHHAHAPLQHAQVGLALNPRALAAPRARFATWQLELRRLPVGRHDEEDGPVRPARRRRFVFAWAHHHSGWDQTTKTARRHSTVVDSPYGGCTYTAGLYLTSIFRGAHRVAGSRLLLTQPTSAGHY